MIEFIQDISELGWTNTLLGFVLVVCIIVTAVSGYKKLLSTLGLKSTQSLKEEQMQNDLIRMQQQIEAVNKRVDEYRAAVDQKQETYHSQSVEIRDKLNEGQEGLRQDISVVKGLLEEFMTAQNKSTVAMLRSSLWRLHKEFVAQDFVTPDGLKTFMEMGKVYEAAGGDDIYHEKLLPEVEALDIHYPDGSIYNQKDL